MGTYRLAQVCPNGHVATDSADRFPERRERYCSICGEPTLTQCPHCDSGIRGDYEVEGVFIASEYEPPSYCHNCGEPFPWTERKIEAAIELVREVGNLSADELKQFECDLGELAKDSPRVQVASVRFKNVMQKVGGTVASGVLDIVVDIFSETAKKAVWGS